MCELTDVDRAREIMGRALVRMDDGAKKYGRYNPHTDQRDLVEWAQEEILDLINYACMLHEKIEATRTPKESELMRRVAELEYALEDIRGEADSFGVIVDVYDENAANAISGDPDDQIYHLANYVYHRADEALEVGA